MPSNLFTMKSIKNSTGIIQMVVWSRQDNVLIFLPLSLSFLPSLPPFLPSLFLFLSSKESNPFKYKVTTVPTHHQGSQPTVGEHSISKCRTSGPMCSTRQQASATLMNTYFTWGTKTHMLEWCGEIKVLKVHVNTSTPYSYGKLSIWQHVIRTNWMLDRMVLYDPCFSCVQDYTYLHYCVWVLSLKRSWCSTSQCTPLRRTSVGSTRAGSNWWPADPTHKTT